MPFFNSQLHRLQRKNFLKSILIFFHYTQLYYFLFFDDINHSYCSLRNICGVKSPSAINLSVNLPLPTLRLPVPLKSKKKFHII